MTEPAPGVGVPKQQPATPLILADPEAALFRINFPDNPPDLILRAPCDVDALVGIGGEPLARPLNTIENLVQLT